MRLPRKFRNLRGLLLLGPVLIASPDPADRAADAAACRQVNAQIRRVESQMRAGYSAKRGVQLEARLRKLRDKRYRICR